MDIIYISFLEAEVPRINPCSLCNFSLNRPLQLVRGGFTNQDPTLYIFIQYPKDTYTSAHLNCGQKKTVPRHLDPLLQRQEGTVGSGMTRGSAVGAPNPGGLAACWVNGLSRLQMI